MKEFRETVWTFMYRLVTHLLVFIYLFYNKYYTIRLLLSIRHTGNGFRSNKPVRIDVVQFGTVYFLKTVLTFRSNVLLTLGHMSWHFVVWFRKQPCNWFLLTPVIMISYFFIFFLLLHIKLTSLDNRKWTELPCQIYNFFFFSC